MIASNKVVVLFTGILCNQKVLLTHLAALLLSNSIQFIML